jgi:hypothetical protein
MTDLLEQRLAELANPIDDSDWLSVRRKARRPLVAAGVVAMAAAAAALFVTPAFGLGERLVDLIQGPPATPEIQTYFAANDALREQLFAASAAAGHDLHDRYSRVIAGEARGVAAIESPDGPIYLWAAPTEDGRQCWLIQAGAEAATGRPYGYGSCDEANRRSALVTGTFWTGERPSILIVHARVYDDEITTVEVELEDGSTLPLTVVAGYALGTIPKEASVKVFVGRDSEGEAIDMSTG